MMLRRPESKSLPGRHRNTSNIGQGMQFCIGNSQKSGKNQDLPVRCSTFVGLVCCAGLSTPLNEKNKSRATAWEVLKIPPLEHARAKTSPRVSKRRKRQDLLHGFTTFTPPPSPHNLNRQNLNRQKPADPFCKKRESTWKNMRSRHKRQRRL